VGGPTAAGPLATSTPAAVSAPTSLPPSSGAIPFSTVSGLQAQIAVTRVAAIQFRAGFMAAKLKHSQYFPSREKPTTNAVTGDAPRPHGPLPPLRANPSWR
jgi:hypothetical protein